MSTESAAPAPSDRPWACVVMGVSGCGKSVVGAEIARQWNQRQPQPPQQLPPSAAAAAASAPSLPASDPAPAPAIFLDGDDYHPASNKAKMASGVPLDDSDRAGWLRTIAGLLREGDDQAQCRVVACSALKPKYRQIIFGRATHMEGETTGAEPTASAAATITTPVAAPTATASSADSASSSSQSSSSRSFFLVYLRGTFDLLDARLKSRKGHFMKAGMLRSQLNTLVEPTEDECSDIGVRLLTIDLDEHTSVQQIAAKVVDFIGAEQQRQQQQQQRQ